MSQALGDAFLGLTPSHVGRRVVRCLDTVQLFATRPPSDPSDAITLQRRASARQTGLERNEPVVASTMPTVGPPRARGGLLLASRAGDEHG